MKPGSKLKWYSFLYSEIPIKRLVFAAFVALAMFMIFIRGTQIGLALDNPLIIMVSSLEFGFILGIVGISLIYPEKYFKHIAIAIILFSIMTVIIELFLNTISMESFIGVAMVICGVVLFALNKH